MNRKPLIQKYALVPIAVYLIGIPLYFMTRLFMGDAYHYDASLPIDSLIPFVPAFIWIYVLAFLQWFIGYYSLSRSDERICKKYFGAEILGKSICVIIFILFPTIMTRPEITGDGASLYLVRWIYAVDSPDNLLPSIHCLESWLVARGLLETKAPKTAKILMWVFSLLVFMSVVLVKQHLILDIFAGIAVAELGIILSEKIGMHRFYTYIEKKIGL